MKITGPEAIEGIHTIELTKLGQEANGHIRIGKGRRSCRRARAEVTKLAPQILNSDEPQVQVNPDANPDLIPNPHFSAGSKNDKLPSLKSNSIQKPTLSASFYVNARQMQAAACKPFNGSLDAQSDKDNSKTF